MCFSLPPLPCKGKPNLLANLKKLLAEEGLIFPRIYLFETFLFLFFAGKKVDYICLINTLHVFVLIYALFPHSGPISGLLTTPLDTSSLIFDRIHARYLNSILASVYTSRSTIIHSLLSESYENLY